jgi:hypothetical protein
MLGALSEREADEFEETAARTLAILPSPIPSSTALRDRVIAEVQALASDEIDTAIGRRSRLRRSNNEGDADRVLRVLSSSSDVRRTRADFLSDEATVALVSSASLKTAVAMVSGLPDPPSGHAYQFWYIRKGRPRAAGTFRSRSGVASEVVLDGRYRRGDVVAVTLEPDGGSRKPTTTPLFALET